MWASVKAGSPVVPEAVAAALRRRELAPGLRRVLRHQQRFACDRANHTLFHLQDPCDVAAWQAARAVAGETVAAEPEWYELHDTDETRSVGIIAAILAVSSSLRPA